MLGLEAGYTMSQLLIPTAPLPEPFTLLLFGWPQDASVEGRLASQTDVDLANCSPFGRACSPACLTA